MGSFINKVGVGVGGDGKTTRARASGGHEPAPESEASATATKAGKASTGGSNAMTSVNAVGGTAMTGGNATTVGGNALGGAITTGTDAGGSNAAGMSSETNAAGTSSGGASAASTSLPISSECPPREPATGPCSVEGKGCSYRRAQTCSDGSEVSSYNDYWCQSGRWTHGTSRDNFCL